MEVNALLAKSGVISKIAKEQVSDSDIRRLRPGQWLNDEVINFYGQLISSRSMEAEAAKENEKKLLNVHVFNTFFWPKMKSGYEKGRLAKWTKKVSKNIFGHAMEANLMLC
jgi:sentrin-specific protease 1